MSVAIKIDQVIKRYGEHTVIKGLSADIRPGEFFTLLGPSGCGKTTLLRMIIGFNTIEDGKIYIENRLINQVPTNKRKMGMVFQDYAVFPHMSVAANVGFGLNMQKVPKEEAAGRVEEILKIVKIDALKDRMPAELSGGQRQRVALARAIVIRPEVLLMDEPLSNLDAKLRVEMRNAIKNIQHQIGITTVYVTHDQEEALAVSDRIAVMNDGIIQQIDTPQQLYQRPSNRFVATFIGQSNLITAKLIEKDGRKYVDFGHRYLLEMNNLSAAARDGMEVCVSIRPEEFSLAGEGENGIPAVVKSSVFLGASITYFVRTENGEEIEVIQDTDEAAAIPEGTHIKLKAKARKINLFTADGKETLIGKGGDGT